MLYRVAGGDVRTDDSDRHTCGILLDSIKEQAFRSISLRNICQWPYVPSVT